MSLLPPTRNEEHPNEELLLSISLPICVHLRLFPLLFNEKLLPIYRLASWQVI
jgi:hypothetical protein